MDRKNRKLIINSTWHETWFKPDESLENGFSETLESFARFNGADEIEFKEKKPRMG